MFNKFSDSKSDLDRLRPTSPPQNAAEFSSSSAAATNNNPNDRLRQSSSSATSKHLAAMVQQQQQQFLNKLTNNIPSKEETKSYHQNMTRVNGILNSFTTKHSQQTHSNSNHEAQVSSNATFLNQRNSQQQHYQQQTNCRLPVGSSAYIYQIPSFQPTTSHHHHHHHAPQYKTNNLKFPPSTSASSGPSYLRDDNKFPTTHNSSSRHEQSERDRSEDLTTILREEQEENDLEGLKESELDALSSFERDLPVELSFLIRQQAYCMAKMNFLDRQIRELRETRQTDSTNPQILSTSIMNHHQTRNSTTNATAAAMTHMKNGNFILSDDSGGEYSRATISDEDELSSLLDQIAKSIKSERNGSVTGNNQHPQRASTSYSVISNHQPHHQFATIVNPNHLHQQAVPIFVMGSPIAVAHPSSVSSNVLPGVHFQPEPRYNQYYEDFYGGHQSSTLSTQIPRHDGAGLRSQQFDSNISAIEQLVSQKEKRQIKSQLRSVDNWLKMRSSSLCNATHANGGSYNNGGSNNNKSMNGTRGDDMETVGEGANIPAGSSSATIATENNRVIAEEASAIR